MPNLCLGATKYLLGSLLPQIVPAQLIWVFIQIGKVFLGHIAAQHKSTHKWLNWYRAGWWINQMERVACMLEMPSMPKQYGMEWTTHLTLAKEQQCSLLSSLGAASQSSVPGPWSAASWAKPGTPTQAPPPLKMSQTISIKNYFYIRYWPPKVLPPCSES